MKPPTWYISRICTSREKKKNLQREGQSLSRMHRANNENRLMFSSFRLMNAPPTVLCQVPHSIDLRVALLRLPGVYLVYRCLWCIYSPAEQARIVRLPVTSSTMVAPGKQARRPFGAVVAFALLLAMVPSCSSSSSSSAVEASATTTARSSSCVRITSAARSSSCVSGANMESFAFAMEGTPGDGAESARHHAVSVCLCVFVCGEGVGVWGM